MDMSKLFGQVKDMQEKLKERMKDTQENLGKITTIAESGGGLVKVEINGLREIIGMSIDPSLLTEEKKQMLQDLVMAAVNIGIQDIEVKIKEEMKKTTDGLLPNIPGLDFNL